MFNWGCTTSFTDDSKCGIAQCQQYLSLSLYSHSTSTSQVCNTVTVSLRELLLTPAPAKVIQRRYLRGLHPSTSLVMLSYINFVKSMKSQLYKVAASHNNSCMAEQYTSHLVTSDLVWHLWHVDGLFAVIHMCLQWSLKETAHRHHLRSITGGVEITPFEVWKWISWSA